MTKHLLVDEGLLDDDHLQGLFSNCPYRLMKEMDLVSFEEVGDFHLYQERCYQDVYILVKGELEIYLTSRNGNRVVLDIYQQAGSLIGEQEAILDYPYSASVRNVTPCQLIHMSNHIFLEWLESDWVFAQNFIKNQCEQVYHLAKETGRYTLSSVKNQVAFILLDWYDKGKTMTKPMIQQAVPATNRHINRVLSELAEENLIAIHHSQIQVLNPEKLTFYGEE